MVFHSQGAVDLKILADTLEDVPAHPELVTGVDAHARADLVLPLPRHHLRVGAADLQPSEQARAVFSIRVESSRVESSVGCLIQSARDTRNQQNKVTDLSSYHHHQLTVRVGHGAPESVFRARPAVWLCPLSVRPFIDRCGFVPSFMERVRECERTVFFNNP